MGADDDLATTVGVLIGMLFYTCVVLGCVRAFQCWWLFGSDYDDDDDRPDASLHGQLLPAGVAAGGEEVVVEREAVTMRQPQEEHV